MRKTGKSFDVLPRDSEDESVVYVVDGEAEMLHFLKRILRQAGLRSRTFVSADAFLRTCRPELPGCLLLDLHAPGIDGLELQKILQDRHCNLPIVILTGAGDVQAAVVAIKAGAVDLLEKPLDGGTLVESVRHALQLDGIFRENRRRLAERDIRMTQLTRREREVMEGMIEGKTSRAIAGQLGLSVRTVEGHRAAVMKKMQTGSLAELLHLASMK